MKTVLSLSSALVLILGVPILSTAQSLQSGYKPFATPFVTQSQYIESSILRDAGLMLVYAKKGHAREADVTVQTNGPARGHYQVSLTGTKVDIMLGTNSPMWEPARYETSIAKLAEALALPRTASEPSQATNTLRDLENPVTENLAGISLDLSEKLKRRMLDSALQEKAALLLAAFALRERLEPYEDLRWALSRLTAHLTISRWNSGGRLGVEGRYALTTAYALMNLQTNALGRLGELQAEPASNVHWNRALHARITFDPRALMALPATELSRLEWAERVNAVRRSNGQMLAVKDAQKMVKTRGDTALDAEMFFCMFRGSKPDSVGLGRALYLDHGIQLTLQDLGTAWHVSKGSALKLEDSRELARCLNVLPGFCVQEDGQLAVLDWGAWAMQSQRALGVLYTRSLEFMEKSWGLPKSDIERQQFAMDQLLGKLWLTSCVRGRAASQPQLAQAQEIFAARPQIVPIYCLRGLLDVWEMPHTDPKDSSLQNLLAFYRWPDGFPNGTFVNLEGNWLYLGDFSQVIQQAPYRIDVLRWFVEHMKPNAAQTERLLHDLASYSSWAGRMLADNLPADQVQAKEAAYLRLAQQDPDFYLNLCELFHANPAKAAAYFEKARANGADPVGIANRAEPYVIYYLSIGDRKKAEELAQESEQVGSASGFEAMMRYCAKTRAYDRGLKTARAEAERYGDTYPVPYYIEMIKQDQPNYHEFDNVYQQGLAKLFPSGIGPAQPSSDPPSCGALVENQGRELWPRDVITAVDGKLVQSADQLRYLRRIYTLRTGEGEKIPMTVYRQPSYLEVKDTTGNIGISDFKGSGVIAPHRPVPTVPFRKTSSPAPAANQPLLAQLRLNGLSGVTPHRLAIINGKTIEKGETTSIKVAGQSVVVHCLSIGEGSATVSIDGVNGTKELLLNP